MMLSRRRVVQAALASIVAPALSRVAYAQPSPAGNREAFAPVVFVHGNGDHAALWVTTLWRFESNGYPHDHLTAFNFIDPSARTNDAEAKPGYSSTEDQLRELAAAIALTRQRTGAARVALVGNSRGGNSIRNFVQSGGASQVSHVVLCGVPNRGVYISDTINPGNEFNGHGPFLQRLNSGATDVVPGTAFLTLRSEGNDKYAQPDGRFIGRPGEATGIDAEGPTLRGALNLALGQLDHREVAFHPRAFREIFRFITGTEPQRLGVVAQAQVTLDGLVTGFPAALATNRPLVGATIEIYRVSPETGERLGAPMHRRVVGADGRWGPVNVEPTWFLEFVIVADGHSTTHIYRSPFPRSSSIVHVRPGRPLGEKDAGAGAVVLMSRPPGYFGIPRDVVLFDGKVPADVKPGVPTDSAATLLLAPSEIGRPVNALFNEERIVARAWPAAENRITIAEFTY